MTSIISLLGFLTPFLSTGTAFLTVGLRFAIQERKMHQKETKKNCMTVSVTGLGSAVKIALEDAFVRMEAENHTMHNIWYSYQ